MRSKFENTRAQRCPNQKEDDMAVTKEEIIEALKEMTALELSELVHELEDVFGVSAAAPMAIAAAPAAAAEPEEEKEAEEKEEATPKRGRRSAG